MADTTDKRDALIGCDAPLGRPGPDPFQDTRQVLAAIFFIKKIHYRTYYYHQEYWKNIQNWMIYTQYDDFCHYNWSTEIPVDKVLGYIPICDKHTCLRQWICVINFWKSYKSGQTLFCREFCPLSSGPIYLKILSLI